MLHCAEYNTCNIYSEHDANVIPIACLCMHTITVLFLHYQEGICSLKPELVCCSFQSSFSWCSTFILHLGLRHIYTSHLLICLT